MGNFILQVLSLQNFYILSLNFHKFVKITTFTNNLENKNEKNV